MTLTIVLSLLVLIPLLYGLLCLFLYLGQSHLVYHPERHLEAYPSDIGLQFEKLTLEASDAERINAWFIPSDTPRATLLFCHGNAGNISHRLETIRILHELHLDVLLFDYRGFGQSTGTPTEKGTYLDARAAWNYLTQTRGISPDRIVIFGRSLGGAVAAHLAADADPAGLILESTFTSILDMGAELYPFLPVRVAARFKYNTLERLKKTQCPVLVVHSRDDRLVPFHHGRALFEAVPGEKRFLEIEGAHNDGFLISGLGYLAGIDAFCEMIFEKEKTESPAPR